MTDRLVADTHVLRRELYLNRGGRTANLELLRELEANRRLIEKAYGFPFGFEDHSRERRAVRIAECQKGHLSRTDEFDDYLEWFIDRGIRIRRALERFQAGA